MTVYFDMFLLDQQCGFRKGYSRQDCLLNLLEKWKNSWKCHVLVRANP